MATIKSSSGGKFAETVVQRLDMKIKGLKEPATLRVGFLEKAKYPDGTPVAMVAAIQEYGAPRAKIPPRPFFRNMIAEKKGEWPAAIAGVLMQGQLDAKVAFGRIGAAIAGQLRESITKTNQPPLSPVTLMLRKMRGDNPDLVVTGKTVGEAAARVAAGESSSGVSTKPLIWSSHLINSVDFEVKT